ncbi:MAG: hypothetical protein U5R31_10905 [Acidimicrobiia bacterium]|nr:hypothetical protein [Acidimicrobiia bacterium]
MIVAAACVVASAVWGRSARYRARVLRKVQAESGDADVKALARSDFNKDVHTAVLYAVIAAVAGVGAFASRGYWAALLLLVLLPVVVSVLLSRNFVQRRARSTRDEVELERRAQEVLTQEALAAATVGGPSRSRGASRTSRDSRSAGCTRPAPA